MLLRKAPDFFVIEGNPSLASHRSIKGVRKMKFNELGLDSALLESIEKWGLRKQLPIQAQNHSRSPSGQRCNWTSANRDW